MSAPTYPYLPLPSAPTEPFAHPRPRPSVLPVRARLPAVAHRVSARHPLRAIASAPDVPYAPLRPRPATRLRALSRRRGGPSGSQRGQGKSDLPWPLVNARLTLTRRARRSIGRIGRAGARPTDNPDYHIWPISRLSYWMSKGDRVIVRLKQTRRTDGHVHLSFKNQNTDMFSK
jgi:hypothetical protein